MHYLLHIDTSVDSATISIGRDGVLVSSRMSQESRNHAATINAMINEVMGDADISLADLSAVVVCAGPGSYTGLRIGMATAKGLCYVLNIPLILDNKLYLLAYDACVKTRKEYARYISLMIARDSEYFVAVYDSELNCLVAPQHVMEEQLKDLIRKTGSAYFITDALAEVIYKLDIKDVYIDNNLQPDIKRWVATGLEKYICNNIVNLSIAEPFYLKQVYTRN